VICATATDGAKKRIAATTDSHCQPILIAL
jgi:hypothetical protein